MAGIRMYSDEKCARLFGFDNLGSDMKQRLIEDGYLKRQKKLIPWGKFIKFKWDKFRKVCPFRDESIRIDLCTFTPESGGLSVEHCSFLEKDCPIKHHYKKKKEVIQMAKHPGSHKGGKKSTKKGSKKGGKKR